MTTFTAAPILTFVGADPNIDGQILQQELPPEVWAANLGDPHFAITVEWTMPEPKDKYTHVRVVRSVRAPARRAEEGQTMAEYPADEWPTHDGEFGRPIYTDVQPPSREWVFYTLFFLDLNRVWTYGGSAGEMGPGDFDWTLRLPELLPGAAVNNESGVMHPADQDNTLTTFLQGPGVLLDIATSMGEAVQYFWDPLRCPPHALPHLSKSWGYRYDETLGLGRTRYVLNALKAPDQGSMQAVQRLVDGVMGNPATVVISNNLMLDINDSSFESGNIMDQGWGPLRTNIQSDATSLRLEQHSTTIGDTVMPPNVSFEYYLSIPSGQTIGCGYYTAYDKNGNVEPDKTVPTPPPIMGKPYPLRIFDAQRRGIPLQGWSVVRMGCYAKVPSGTGTISMSLDIYDSKNSTVPVANLPVLPSRTINNIWKWVGSGDDKSAIPPGSNQEGTGATAANKWSVPLPTNVECAYGVPRITVSNASHIDLIVVDDG